MKPAVETKKLRKIYNSHGVITKALDGVDIKIEKGEFVDVKIESSNEFELIGTPV